MYKEADKEVSLKSLAPLTRLELITALLKLIEKGDKEYIAGAIDSGILIRKKYIEIRVMKRDKGVIYYIKEKIGVGKIEARVVRGYIYLIMQGEEIKKMLNYVNGYSYSEEIKKLCWESGIEYKPVKQEMERYIQGHFEANGRIVISRKRESPTLTLSTTLKEESIKLAYIKHGKETIGEKTEYKKASWDIRSEKAVTEFAEYILSKPGYTKKRETLKIIGEYYICKRERLNKETGHKNWIEYLNKFEMSYLRD